MSTTILPTADGASLADLLRVRGGRVAAKGSAGLESQLAYIAETKDDHRYSPAVNRLFDLVTGYIPGGEAAWKAGKSVTWFTGGVWGPLCYACDTIPISTMEMGRLGSAEALNVAEDYYHLPKEACPMVGGILGEYYLRQGRTSRRVIAYNAMCEPLNIGLELLKDEGFDIYRVEAINRPNAHDDDDRITLMESYMRQEIRDLARWLTGRDLDEAKLAVELKRVNRIFRKVRRVLDLRLTNPHYLKSLGTMYLILGTSHYFGQPEVYETMLDDLIRELETAPPVPSPTGRTVPLAWVGSRGQEYGVYKAIDDAGGAIVQWHIPDEHTQDYREDLPALEAYAHYILSGRLGGSPVRRLKSIEEHMERYGSKGMVFYTYQGCSFGGIHKEIQRDYFHKLGVPSLSLEGSFQVGPPTGQLLTRIRAFIEMFS